MVDSISGVGANAGKYDITYEQLDANKDGKVNKDDYDLLKGYITDDDETNDVNITVDNLDDIFETVLSEKATELEDCPNCREEAPEKADNTSSTTKTADDVDKAVTDLLAKYPIPAGGGSVDKYSLDNPEMKAFKNAIDGGAIKELANQGFTQTQVIDIIAKAFPSIGIKNNANGGYDCPYGHGDAKAVYDSFVAAIGTITSADTAALKAEVKKLNDEIVTNNLQLNTLKGSIEKIQEEVEKAVSDALKQSEEIAEEQKKEAETAVKEELAKYTESEGEMSYSQFQENLKGRLDNVQTTGGLKMSKVIFDIMNAESKMDTLKGYVDKFGALVKSNKALTLQVQQKTSEIKEEENKPSNDCTPNRCDPIGFSADGIKYDFFVDKDNNNKLSNEQEFLGAEKGWQEMSALDTNDDGKVDANEMKDLKVVATAADGTQEIKNASDLFGVSDSIDLSSYSEVNKDFDNGNTLLGTFSVNFGGKEITDGYNTMDKVSWLDENYDFSDKDDGIGRFAQGNEKVLDAANYEKELEGFNAKIAELDTKIDNAWTNIGLKRSEIKDTIIKGAKKEAEAKAEEIENLFAKAKVEDSNENTNPPENPETPNSTEPSTNPDDEQNKLKEHEVNA